MIENKEIFACIYIRSIIDLDTDKSYYTKSIATNLAYQELKFVETNREIYDKIVKQSLEVWKIVQEGKSHFMIQSIPLIGALYHQVKEEFTDMGVPKIIFHRLTEKYIAVNDDKYEVRSYQLAKEIYKTTQEVVENGVL